MTAPYGHLTGFEIHNYVHSSADALARPVPLVSSHHLRWPAVRGERPGNRAALGGCRCGSGYRGLIALGGGTACCSIRLAMGPRQPALPVLAPHPACARRLPGCRTVGGLPAGAIRAVCSLRYRERLRAAPVAAGVAGEVR